MGEFDDKYRLGDKEEKEITDEAVDDARAVLEALVDPDEKIEAELEADVLRLRGERAKWDKHYAELREHNESPTVENIAESLKVLGDLNAAELRLRKFRSRFHESFGCCPMNWPEEE